MSEGILPTRLEGYAGKPITGRLPEFIGSNRTREVTFWLIDDPHFVNGRWVALANFQGSLVLIELRVSIK